MRSRKSWVTTVVLSAFLAVLRVVQVSPAVPPLSKGNAHPAAAIANEPLLPGWSLEKATRFLDAGARDRETKCINCHASFAYLMARPALPIHTEKHREVRETLENWVAYLDELQLDTTSDSRRRAEAVMSAAVLALHDAATSGRLHAVTRRALDLTWRVQLPDGGYDWLKPNNEPPSAMDNHFGATMSAMAAGAAPDDYANSPEAREHIEKLRSYLRAHPPQHMHQRGMLMLADHFLGGLMSEQARRQTVADMFALQHRDGGWSMAALGDDTWKRKDKTPQDLTTSDGYGTGFSLYVLCTAGGIPAEDTRIQRAIAWLKSHQRTSGGWYSRSPKNSDAFASYVGTAYAILALKACGEIPYAPEIPEFVEGSWNYQLPSWFDDWRCHVHTRLSTQAVGMIRSDIFTDFSGLTAPMGVKIISRHVKSGSDGPFYPTQVGKPSPLANENNDARRMIREAHQNGQRIILYYWHMAEDYFEELHPEWLCRDPKGKPVSVSRGELLCMNSPYADITERRLLELVDLGTDGFYFDYVHMPRTGGCWCDFCKKKFKEETGLDHPPAADPRDPVFQELVAFNNMTMATTFDRWRRAIHARNPAVVMCVSSSAYANMMNYHMTELQFRISDSTKTELGHPTRADEAFFSKNRDLFPADPDAKMALGWTVCRDASDGRPAHVWLPRMRSETQALYGAAGVVTHGCVANLDFVEEEVPDRHFLKALEVGNRVSPYFRRTEPLRWAVIHYSERGRNARLFQDTREAWVNALYPLFGPWKTLLRDRLPVSVITDSLLAQGRLNGVDTLILPMPDALTDTQKAVVAAFEQRGGVVVRHDPTWRWHDREGHVAAMNAFREVMAPHAAKVPIQVVGGPERMHAMPYQTADGSRLTISICNDFHWIHVVPDAGTPKPPAACDGVIVVLRGERAPKRVFEAVNGAKLTPKQTTRGLEIAVPTFDAWAVLVAEY